jgi:hypothetical protein
MSGWTNKGKHHYLDQVARNTAEKTNYYLALITSATAPTADHNTLGQFTEVAAGNGYTAGGIQIARNATDFDVMTEDDTNDIAFWQLKDMVWTASGGTLPGSGSGARYAVFTDDNATVASREVYHFWDLTSDQSVSSGQTLTLQNVEARLTE